MLPEQLETFKLSGKQFNSEDLVKTYLEIRDRLTFAFTSSPSADSDGREELYRQIKGLDAVFGQLIAGWSK